MDSCLFASVVERIDSCASMYSRSIQGHHVCLLVKTVSLGGSFWRLMQSIIIKNCLLDTLLSPPQSGQTVSIDAKCDEPTLLGNVLDEIKQTFSLCWLCLPAPQRPRLRQRHPFSPCNTIQKNTAAGASSIILFISSPEISNTAVLFVLFLLWTPFWPHCRPAFFIFFYFPHFPHHRNPLYSIGFFFFFTLFLSCSLILRCELDFCCWWLNRIVWRFHVLVSCLKPACAFISVPCFVLITKGSVLLVENKRW